MKASKLYSLIAYRIFAKYLDPYEKSMEVLKLNLKKARIPMIVTEYISMILLTAIILFSVSIIFFFIVFGIILGITGGALIVFSLVAALLLAIIVFVIGWSYPTGEISSRGEKIDSEMPYAVAHMSTIAGTGSPPDVIFTLLSRFKEFKEISLECEEVVRDFEVKGYSLLGAIEEVAGRTPSSKFKDLLWGMVTTIRTGGNLSSYLVSRSKTLMDDRRREGKSFINTLSLFDEIYIIAFVLGPLLAIVMILTMSLIGSRYLPLSPRLMMQVLIYLIVPIGSVGSIYVLKSLRPLEG